MSKSPRYSIACIWLLLALPAMALAGDPLAVAVSVLPEKYFVERVGGARVRVSVMVGPGRSPHTYEPTPKQMAEVAAARVYFRVGVPFEAVWLPRLVENSPHLRVVDCRRGITLQRVREDKVRQDHPDPHVWTSPPLVKIMAANIRDALISLDPAHQADYARGYRGFAADLDALDGDLRRDLAGLKSRRFMVFHPAWGYFAQTYGLQQVAIEREGKEPGARALVDLIDRARREGIRVIFVQAQFARGYAETVARAVGARVVTVDPLAEDYLANMRRVARAFEGALG